MTPQYEHELPNGEHLITVDVQTAREYLVQLVAAFDAGTHDEPLIIGDERKPMAVVLPISQWFDLLDIADEVAADERLAREVGANLADPRPSVPYDEFLKTIHDPRKSRSKDDG
jgi:hypothetical protein